MSDCSEWADTGERRYHMRKTLLAVALSLVFASSYWAFADEEDDARCGLSSKLVNSVQSQLAVVVQLDNGGIFPPNRMWSALADQQSPLRSAVQNCCA